MAKSSAPAAQPARQGFYRVTLQDDTELIGEWREITKGEGKRWWQYVSDSPTAEKVPVPLEGVVDFTPADKKAVEKLLKRELSEEEKLEAAYTSFMSTECLNHRNPCPVPPGRQVQVGDELEIGLLRDVKAVELRDDGQVVIYSFRDVNHNYGNPQDLGIKYRAAHWTEVLIRKHIRDDTLTLNSRMFNAYRSSTLDTVINKMLRGVDDAPDYQRGYAWSAKDKELYLDSVFAGRELGRFIFIRRGYPYRDQILDGKQRLTCLYEFVTSQLAYNGVYWHQLSPRDRDRIENRSVQFAELHQDEFTRVDFLQIFLEVNAAGVPQTEEHLARVRAMLEEERAKGSTSA
jgi:hypothetical protein